MYTFLSLSLSPAPSPRVQEGSWASGSYYSSDMITTVTSFGESGSMDETEAMW